MKTSIDWLAEKLKSEFGFVFSNNILEEAKDIERKQIIDAGNSCALKQHLHSNRIDKMTEAELRKYSEEEHLTFGEDYYNEEFKKEQ